MSIRTSIDGLFSRWPASGQVLNDKPVMFIYVFYRRPLQVWSETDKEKKQMNWISSHSRLIVIDQKTKAPFDEKIRIDQSNKPMESLSWHHHECHHPMASEQMTMSHKGNLPVSCGSVVTWCIYKKKKRPLGWQSGRFTKTLQPGVFMELLMRPISSNENSILFFLFK